MKTVYKVITAVVAAVLVLTVAYNLANVAPSDGLTSNEQMIEILENSGCLMCHTADAKAPSYASMPVVGKIVKADMAEGYRSFDIKPVYDALIAGEMPSEVAVAKIEKEIKDGKMPPFKYAVMHWGAAVNTNERDMVSKWVAEYRLANFLDNGNSKEFAADPVRPIVVSLPTDERKVALGDALFHDTRLSSDNTISCASCHGLNTGGVDNDQFSEGVGGQFGGVNAPTVFNAVFNFVQFWDGRAHDLASQAAGPPLNPVEMASVSWDQIIEKLSADKVFTAQFTDVYPEGYSEATITNAIAEFEKTLITPNSDFDKYLKGDNSAIAVEAVHGYDLFKQNECATCHIGTNLGGQSYELMGLKANYFVDRGTEITNEDHGRFKETKTDRDKHRFKVPTLRNVALTAPYYHDGTVKTLTDAVNSMAKYQAGVTLTSAETADIVAFLESLTGEYKGVKLTNDNIRQ